MPRLLICTVIVSTFFVACNNGSTIDRTQAPAPPLNLPANVQAQPAGDSVKGQVVASPTGIQQVGSSQPAAGLNPAHGQPGHRCDLAVGAPLNSQPAPVTTPVNPPVTNQSAAKPNLPVSQTITPSVQPTGGAGLNPEHGKPGHRCDLAVGAPLSSSPAPSISTKPTTAPASITPVMPANTTPPPTGAGLNPEHGKPGHRCDLAVGAPLPKG